MAELTTQNITMNNLPASQLENLVDNYEGDLKGLVKNLSVADKKVQYTIGRALERIETEEGKKAVEAFLFEEFGEDSRSKVYAWRQSYKEIKGFSDEAKDRYFSSKKVGVTVAQYLYSTSNSLEKAGEDRLSGDDFVSIIDHVEKEGLNVNQAKDYIKSEHLPKQECGGLASSPVEFPDKIQFDDGRDRFEDFRLRECYIEDIKTLLDIENLPEDRLAKGDVIGRYLSDLRMKIQASEASR